MRSPMSSLYWHLLATGDAAVGHGDAAGAGHDDSEAVEAHAAHNPRAVRVHAPRQGRLTEHRHMI